MNCVYHDHDGEQCERDTLLNYPACAAHARIHFTHRADCACDQCHAPNVAQFPVTASTLVERIERYEQRQRDALLAQMSL